jgi:signal transduction histidine kinase
MSNGTAGKIAAEARLGQSQKMEALGRLAGGMAHDLNNCLVPILSLTELALEMLPPESRERECVALIKTAGARIHELVRCILIFSRHEDIATAPLDLAAILRDAASLLRATLPAAIELHCRVACSPAVIEGDQSQLRQVLLNLGANAAEAIGERGRGVIELALEAVELAGALDHIDGTIAPGRYYRLVVGDNGRGMDGATLARIFEPFFTTKPPGAGAGLGLAMVYGIVRCHAGHLRVISSPGVGTTVEIYLPQP